MSYTEDRYGSAQYGPNRDACSVCDTVHDADDLWQITRRPNDEIVTVDERTWDGDSHVVQISGPQHLQICQDCWHKATGFLDALNDVRNATRSGK